MDDKIKKAIEHWRENDAMELGNKVFETPEPKPYDYPTFINELRVLISQAEQFARADKDRASAVFKQWRHELLDSLNRIQVLGYTINTNIETRKFTMVYAKSALEQLRKFESAVEETLIELRLVIRNYERHGDPKAVPVAVPKKKQSLAEFASDTFDALNTPVKPTPKQPLKWEDKPTLAWLWHNMPASAWLALAGAFGLGFTAASWQPISTYLNRVAAAEPYQKVDPLTVKAGDPASSAKPAKGRPPVDAGMVVSPDEDRTPIRVDVGSFNEGAASAPEH